MQQREAPSYRMTGGLRVQKGRMQKTWLVENAVTSPEGELAVGTVSSGKNAAVMPTISAWAGVLGFPSRDYHQPIRASQREFFGS